MSPSADCYQFDQKHSRIATHRSRQRLKFANILHFLSKGSVERILRLGTLSWDFLESALIDFRFDIR